MKKVIYLHFSAKTFVSSFVDILLKIRVLANRVCSEGHEYGVTGAGRPVRTKYSPVFAEKTQYPELRALPPPGTLHVCRPPVHH